MPPWNAEIKGRGAWTNPTNRFERIAVEDDLDQLEELLQAEQEEFASGQSIPSDKPKVVAARKIRTEYFADDSKSLVNKNDSPDISFNYSLNLYRGCAHGCSYCFARPTHEYLGLGAGIDFETKIMVKLNGPALFRDFLNDSSWLPEPIIMSGVTDCYQPAERHFKLTRQILEIALEARQPMCLITKNALVTRDLDLLAPLAAMRLVSVAISITSLDQSLTRVMEPQTSSPAARLRAVRELSSAGVPVTVMVAPIIPGLNDSEMPAVLQAAKEHGASAAHFTLLRLPWSVRPVFLEWLERTHPLQHEKVKSRMLATHEGKMNLPEFGKRQRGTGEIAEQIERTFAVFAKKFGLVGNRRTMDVSLFRRPKSASGQKSLF